MEATTQLLVGVSADHDDESVKLIPVSDEREIRYWFATWVKIKPTEWKNSGDIKRFSSETEEDQLSPTEHGGRNIYRKLTANQEDYKNRTDS